MQHFNSLAIDLPHNLIFGTAPHPVTTRRGLVIGGGKVYPELNFTVPPMQIDDSTIKDVRAMYKSIVIVSCDSHYAASVAVAKETMALLAKASENGEVDINEMERPYLDMLAGTLDTLPQDEHQFIDMMTGMSDTTKYRPDQYDLALAKAA